MFSVVPDLSPLADAMGRRIEAIAETCPTEAKSLQSTFDYTLAPYLRWSERVPAVVYAATRLRLEYFLVELAEAEEKCGVFSASGMSRYASACEEREAIYTRMGAYFAGVGENQAARLLRRVGGGLGCDLPVLEGEPILCQVDHRVIPAVESGYGLMLHEAVYVGEVVGLGCLGPMVAMPDACPMLAVPVERARVVESMVLEKRRVWIGKRGWNFMFWHMPGVEMPDLHPVAEAFGECGVSFGTIEKLDQWYAWSSIGVFVAGCDLEIANQLLGGMDWGLLKYDSWEEK